MGTTPLNQTTPLDLAGATTTKPKYPPEPLLEFLTQNWSFSLKPSTAREGGRNGSSDHQRDGLRKVARTNAATCHQKTEEENERLIAEHERLDTLGPAKLLKALRVLRQLDLISRIRAKQRGLRGVHSTGGQVKTMPP